MTLVELGETVVGFAVAQTRPDCVVVLTGWHPCIQKIKTDAIYITGCLEGIEQL